MGGGRVFMRMNKRCMNLGSGMCIFFCVFGCFRGFFFELFLSFLGLVIRDSCLCFFWYNLFSIRYEGFKFFCGFKVVIMWFFVGVVAFVSKGVGGGTRFVFFISWYFFVAVLLFFSF